MKTSTLERVETEIDTSTDKPESHHYVLEKGEDETAQAHVMRSMVEGTPVTAICGHVFVPSRAAKRLPLCAECKAIYDHNPNGKDRDGLPDE